MGMVGEALSECMRTLQTLGSSKGMKFGQVP